jgi:hypothetical protein
MVLKNRYEKRQKQGNNKIKMMDITVTTPLRIRGLEKQPKSPNNPIDEMEEAHKTTRELWNSEEGQAQERIASLKQRKRMLERGLHTSLINHHRVTFQGVLNDIKKGKGMNGKVSVIIRQLKKKPKKKRYKSVFEAALLEDWEGWGTKADWYDWHENNTVEAEWYDWRDDNQPVATATATKKAKQLTIQEKKKVSLRHQYRQTILEADRVLYEAQEAIKQPAPWVEATAATDGNDNNHYFWHRGRPPEGDY